MQRAAIRLDGSQLARSLPQHCQSYCGQTECLIEMVAPLGHSDEAAIRLWELTLPGSSLGLLIIRCWIWKRDALASAGCWEPELAWAATHHPAQPERAASIGRPVTYVS